MRIRAMAVAFAMVVSGGPAAAAEEQAVFDLVLRGLTAGTVSFASVENGTGYAVRGQVKTGGLASLLRKVRYDATATGSLRRGRYVPTAYTEQADTGRRQSESVMDYKAGVPQVKVYNPPREPKPGDVDPSTMGGSVDPLTALYATLRDVDPGDECTVSLQMFDGRRSTQLRTTNPQADGERVVCTGEYRRLAGYSEKEMAEKQRFAFTLTYAPTPEGRMRVTEVSMETLYGRATLTRR